MIRCLHSSQQKWRQTTISKSCDAMKAHNIALHLQDLFCTALTKWFDGGMVQIEHFHDSYHGSLVLQQQIGSIYLLMGLRSSKWEALYDIFHPKENTASTWTATMIETGLQAMIQLWEQRNGDLHGKSKTKQNRNYWKPDPFKKDSNQTTITKRRHPQI